MKRSLYIVLLLSFTSCATDPEFERKEIFPISATYVNSDAQKIQLHVLMEVGPDGCHSFEKFTSERVGDVQRLRFFSKHDITPGISCTLALVVMNDTVDIPRSSGVGTIAFRLASGVDTTIAIAE